MKDLWFWSLRWDEVDPSRHPFDEASALDVVSAMTPFRHPPLHRALGAGDGTSSTVDQSAVASWVTAVSYELVAHYGRWAVGWGFSEVPDEFAEPFTFWRDTLQEFDHAPARLVDGLTEWRGWIEDLARWFDERPPEPGSSDIQTRWWRDTTRELVLRVSERTTCASSWYTECELILSWFLQRWGVDGDLTADLVRQAIGGRFQSWCGPDADVLDDVSTRLAGVASTLGPTPATQLLPDHLREWLVVRDTVGMDEVPATGQCATKRPGARRR